MALIRRLHPDDYLPAFNLSKRMEPYLEHDYDQYCAMLRNRYGFTVWTPERELLSMVTYEAFYPDNTITVHFLQDIDRKGGFTKEVVKATFVFPFIILKLPRVMSYAVPGVTGDAGAFLERIGFQREGVLREASRLTGGPHDLEIYGMLRRECRWLGSNGGSL